jgi:nucleoid DNA-binding protein
LYKGGVNKQQLIQQLLKNQTHRGADKTAIAEVVRSIFDHMILAMHRRKKFYCTYKKKKNGQKSTDRRDSPGSIQKNHSF